MTVQPPKNLPIFLYPSPKYLIVQDFFHSNILNIIIRVQIGTKYKKQESCEVIKFNIQIQNSVQISKTHQCMNKFLTG